MKVGTEGQPIPQGDTPFHLIQGNAVSTETRFDKQQKTAPEAALSGT
jgi:hypothetical protein